MDRADRRRLKKDATKLVRRVTKQGLRPASSPIDVAAASLSILSVLNDKKRRQAPSDAGSLVSKILDRSTPAAREEVAIECKEGCSWCCHVFTSASAPEVFAIARHIRETRSGEEIKHLIDSSKVVVGVGLDQHFLEKLPCPLLNEGRCSIYAHRPISCRKLASVSSKACQTAFEHPTEEVPYALAYWALGDFARMALYAAVEAKGLKAQSYELAEALTRVLTTPDAERRWMAGEDIFDGCQVDPDTSEDFIGTVQSIAAVIR